MYPVLKEGVSIGTFQYEGSEDIHYFIENADGEEFEISHNLWKALIQADGSQPLALPDGGKNDLPFLKMHELVRTSRFVRDKGMVNRFILFSVGNRIKTKSMICRAINALLPVVSILILIIGVYLVATTGVNTETQLNWVLYYFLFICSIVLHEGGHLVAGISYGYNISDTGILLFGLIPIGAYVAHREKEEATKSEKIQFALAGIEVNLLIAGVSLIVATQSNSFASTMIGAAILNLILAGTNLLPTSGLDGEFVLNAVFKVDSIQEEAKKWLFNKKRRKKLLDSGLSGCMCFCVFASTLISKVLLWLTIGLEVVFVVYDVVSAFL